MSELKSEPGSSWPRSPATPPPHGGKGWLASLESSEPSGDCGSRSGTGRTPRNSNHGALGTSSPLGGLGLLICAIVGPTSDPSVPGLRASRTSPPSTMRFQPQGASSFFLLLYITPLLTFGPSLRTGPWSSLCKASCLDHSTARPWEAFLLCSHSTQSFPHHRTEEKHWECPSIRPPRPRGCSVRKGCGHLLSQNLTQRPWHSARSASGPTKRASGLVFLYLLTFSLGLSIVLFLVVSRGERHSTILSLHSQSHRR